MASVAIEGEVVNDRGLLRERELTLELSGLITAGDDGDGEDANPVVGGLAGAVLEGGVVGSANKLEGL